MPQSVKVVGIAVFENEAFVNANLQECHRRAAYMLVDSLLELGAIDFDTSGMVTLCGCMPNEECYHVPDPSFAVRATIKVAATCDRLLSQERCG
jgi:hypothetical protein